jgi:hypothetical protein
MDIVKPFVLTHRFEEILKTIYFYRYMTAQDVARLLYSPTSLTHVREILASLASAEYLYRFQMPHVKTGNTEKIYTLGSRGREFLMTEVGLTVDWWFRPARVKHLSYGQVVHDLVLTRFCVAAAAWAAKQSNFNLLQTRTCYELAKTAGKVVPDAWLLFERLRGGVHDTHFPVILEIDRGRENQGNFKRHLRARIEFIKRGGEYSKLFGHEAVAIAYAATSESERYRDTRLRAMRSWTNEVLKELGKTSWSPIFRFHSLNLIDIYQSDIFEASVWYRPDSALPLQLFAT